MQQRLVKSRLVLIGHNQDLGFFAGETLRQLFLTNAFFHPHFGEIALWIVQSYGPGKRNQRFDVRVPFLRNVPIKFHLIAHGVLA